MKKQYIIALFLALTVLIAGCRLGSSQSGGTTTTSFPTQSVGTYTLKVNEGVTISGKTIKLISVDSSSGGVILYVDGEILEFPATRIPKVSRNLEIQTIRVDYGRTPLDHTATVDIQLFELGPNEYFIRASEKVVVANTEVKFIDLTTVDGARINVNLNEYTVDLGRTVNALNLQITNKKAFDHPQKANRYVVLEIVPL